MSETTTIFLVRHGETEWNVLSKLQGHGNSPLTAKGRLQATSLNRMLSRHEISAAYSSPLTRALETAELILEGRSIEVEKNDKLMEIGLGPWEGKTKEETRRSHPREYEDFWHRQHRFSLIGAETYLQLQNRVVSGLKEIALGHPGKNVLVVTHWIAIKTAVAYFTSTPLSRLETMADLGNGDILVLIGQGDRYGIYPFSGV